MIPIDIRKLPGQAHVGKPTNYNYNFFSIIFLFAIIKLFLAPDEGAKNNLIFLKRK